MLTPWKKHVSILLILALMMSITLQAGAVSPGEPPFAPEKPVEVIKPTATAYNVWPDGFTKGNNAFSNAVADGENVWMIPAAADHVVKVDGESGEMTGYNSWPDGFTKGTSTFTAGVFDGDNIWLVPGTASHLVKLNTDTGTMTSYDSWPDGCSKTGIKFSDGVYDGQSVWLIPHSFECVVKVDTDSGEMTGYSSWPFGFTKSVSFTISTFNSGAFDGQSIWLVPGTADRLIKLNPSTGEMTGYNSWPSGYNANILTNKFTQTTFDGKNLWFVASDRVIKANTETGAMTGYANWPDGVGTKSFGRSVFDGTNLWLVPVNANGVVRMNTLTGNMKVYYNNLNPFGASTTLGSGTNAYASGIYFKGSVWLIPSNANQVVRISSGEITNFAPTDIQLTATQVLHGSSAGTAIGHLKAIDPGDRGEMTFSLVSPEEAPGMDNDQFRIDGTSLELMQPANADDQLNYKITVRVTDSGGLSFDKLFTIQVVDSKVRLSRDNKKLTLTFKEPIAVISNKTTAALKLQDLFGKVKISQNDTGDNPTFSGLTNTDKVSIAGNKLVITFGTALSTENNRIQVLEGALSDPAGNENDEVVTSLFSADIAGPSVLGTKVAGGNKIITLRFNEAIFNTATGAAAAKATALRQAVTFSTADDNFGPLPGTAKVEAKGARLIVTLPEALTGNSNKIRVAAQALADKTGNKNTSIDTEALELAVNKPQVNAVSIVSKNQILVTWNKPVTPVTAFKDAGLQKVWYSNVAGNFNFSFGIPNAITLSKRTMLVTFSDTITFQNVNNYLKIAANAVKDANDVQNDEIILSSFKKDTVAPVMTNAVMNPGNKVINLTFNENLLLNAVSLIAEVKVSRNGGEPTGLVSPDKVAFKNNTMTVTLNTALSGTNNRIIIDAETFKDASGNLTEELASAPIDTDGTAPEITSVVVGTDNQTVILNFSEVIVGTATGKTAAKIAAIKSALSLSTAGGEFNSLSSTTAVVSLKANQLTVKLPNKLSGSNNKLRINAGALADTVGNQTAQLTTEDIAADTTGPGL